MTSTRTAAARPTATRTDATRTDATRTDATRTDAEASTAGAPGTAAPRYVAPGAVMNRVFNPLVAFVTRRGISLFGSRVLRVRGRVSGEWRETPVNVLTHDGARYLVAPRGTTQWVRNLRVAGTGELRVGRRVETFSATELGDADALKAEVLRAYLQRWKWEVGAFFDGVGPDAPAEELARIEPGHPVFRLA